MSKWKITGQAGWDEKTGNAVYHVTKESKSLNVADHTELAQLLEKAQEQDHQQEQPTN